MNNFFNFNPRLEEKAKEALKKAETRFSEINAMAEYNQQKVLKAFIDNHVSEPDLYPSTGYGYGDIGRDKLDRITAQVFGAEDAIIRHTMTCGTHTLTIALFGILRPGDTMLCVTGRPYDTICPVIGMDGKNGNGSLADYGINYMQCDLKADGTVDLENIEKTLKENKIKMVYIQRSRGYATRPSLTVEKIKEIVDITKSNSEAVVMVDNCYGEFVQEIEPTSVGADLIAGSLIKNPGGGVAKCGGYIAGKKEYVELCACRMTTPSLGREVGASLGNTRDMLMGLFHSPHVTGEALKTAVFASALFGEFGFKSTPSYDEKRADIIEAILLENEDNLIAFCQGLQKGSPVDSFVIPEPWDMPGYPCKVIMAAGAFTLGSSIELSADAPLREPYAVWMQGGLNFHSGKTGVMLAAQEMINRNLI